MPFDKKNNLDIVLFCGSPAAGKSTFYWQQLEPLGYARINQDLLKSVCEFPEVRERI
jgi:bifunctional polynucleotide phosphatase/kinase